MLYMAPFQGITTEVFREVYNRHFSGIDKLFTPFYTKIDKARTLRTKKTALSKTNHNGISVIPQVLSKNADEMMLFANFCSDLGFKEINWNLGCPFPRVANKQRGSGLLPHAEKIDSILEKILPALPLQLSVKCRLGYHSPDEIIRLLPVFNKYPLTELIVHSRLGIQMYKGEVNLDAFAGIIKYSDIKTCYNGDIFSKENFLDKKQRFPGVNIWMLGRGLLADPFLPARIKGIYINDNEALIIRRYVDDLYYAYRQKMNDKPVAINVMKEFWSYLSLSFDNPVKVFGKIKKTKNFNDYEDGVRLAFEKYKWVGNGGTILAFHKSTDY